MQQSTYRSKNENMRIQTGDEYNRSSYRNRGYSNDNLRANEGVREALERNKNEKVFRLYVVQVRYRLDTVDVMIKLMFLRISSIFPTDLSVNIQRGPPHYTYVLI